MLEHITVIGDHSQEGFTIDRDNEALLIVRYEYWPDDDEAEQAAHYDELLDAIMDEGAEVVAAYTKL